jgi:hypothetical protein
MTTPSIAALLLRIRALEETIEIELAKRRAEFHYSVHKRKVKFDQLVLHQHQELKIGLIHYIAHARFLILLTAPFIYSLIVPLVLLDIWLWLYQAICFRIYEIPKVRRSDYLVFDRIHLAYLNLFEKINCAYCTYGNGILAYGREVAAVTEQYWCPIKNAQRLRAAHRHYHEFVDYGDAAGYRQQLPALRRSLQQQIEPPAHSGNNELS